MIYAEKGNRVKQITEADVQRYVEQGYTITDGRGTVLKETVPTDLPTLRLSFQKHTAEIESLKAKVQQLSARVAELQAENDALIAAKETTATPKKKTKATTDKADE